MRTCVNFTHVNKIEAMYERLRIDVKVERAFNFGVYAQPFIHCLYFIYIRKNYARVEIYPHTKHCIKASDTRKGNLFISWNSLRDSLREGIKNDREINHFLPTSKLFCLKMFCERKKYKRFEGYGLKRWCTEQSSVKYIGHYLLSLVFKESPGGHLLILNYFPFIRK